MLIKFNKHGFMLPLPATHLRKSQEKFRKDKEREDQ